MEAKSYSLDLRHFEELLRAKQKSLMKMRESLVKDQVRNGVTERMGDTSHIPTHSADIGSQLFDQEVATVLTAIEIQQLQNIDDALHRLFTGTYGVCQNCEEPIPEARLEALPEARYCVKCEREFGEPKVKVESPKSEISF